jgi:hypothetical protein
VSKGLIDGLKLIEINLIFKLQGVDDDRRGEGGGLLLGDRSTCEPIIFRRTLYVTRLTEFNPVI